MDATSTSLMETLSSEPQIQMQLPISYFNQALHPLPSCEQCAKNSNEQHKSCSFLTEDWLIEAILTWNFEKIQCVFNWNYHIPLAQDRRLRYHPTADHEVTLSCTLSFKPSQFFKSVTSSPFPVLHCNMALLTTCWTTAIASQFHPHSNYTSLQSPHCNTVQGEVLVIACS